MQKYGHRHKTIDPPPDIQQMARQEKLGELRKIYTVSKSRTNSFTCGGMALVFAGFWIFMWGIIVIMTAFFPPSSPTVPTNDPIALVGAGIPGFILLVGGLYLMLSQEMYAHWHIYLWQHGFIYEKKRVRKVFRWNRIATVKASPVAFDPYGRPFYTCLVSLQDGFKVKLENGFAHLPELLDIVLEESARQLSPQELRLANPERVKAFTHIELNQHGISGAQETLFWTAIQEMTVKNGSINILKKEVPESNRHSFQGYNGLHADFSSEERFDR